MDLQTQHQAGDNDYGPEKLLQQGCGRGFGGANAERLVSDRAIREQRGTAARQATRSGWRKVVADGFLGAHLHLAPPVTCSVVVYNADFRYKLTLAPDRSICKWRTAPRAIRAVRRFPRYSHAYRRKQID